MRPAVRVENVSKKYRLGASAGKDDTLGETLRAWLRRRVPRDESRDFWALKNVSFEVEPGEFVGVLGRNGAGKSTLLKILSRVVEPTGGGAELRGRLGSLLEVGTGFHPELTGRENVFLSGSILGMSRAEVRQKFDEIVEFSEIGKFLDTPVKRYSSGMYVRLGFAVAIHLRPEILILDEVLAVGDAAFQKKCFGKMRDVRSSAGTVLFVSHDIAAVRRLCSSAIMLSQGELVAQGPAGEVIDQYLKRDGGAVGRGQWVDLLAQPRTRSTGEAYFARVRVAADFADSGRPIESGGPLAVEIELDVREPLSGVDRLAFQVNDRTSQRLLVVDTTRDGVRYDLGVGRHTFRVRVDRLMLNPGEYSAALLLMKSPGRTIDYIEFAADFEVRQPAADARPRAPDDGLVWADGRIEHDAPGGGND